MDITELSQGGYLVAKVHQLANRVFAKMLKEYGIEEINPAQGRILFALWQGDGISIQELSERTSLKKTTMSSMLNRLEAGGHVWRQTSRADRRETLIYLTEKDRLMRDQYNRVSEQMSELFYRGLEQEEIIRFERTLERILENLLVAEQSQRASY
ncbi:MAG: MarR family winged helix-turn-helix transcriptional regulator [Bacillota bacterium]|jgi:DNA-binding MarR family transcriptional regulator